jgi:hypothetical protein
MYTALVGVNHSWPGCSKTRLISNEYERSTFVVRPVQSKQLSFQRDVVHAAPEKPKRYADHAETSNRPDDSGDRRVVGEDAEAGEQVIPVVDDGFVAANREPR